MPRRSRWSDVVNQHSPLLLPAAHDALTARLIRRAGFPALQIGGFALEGARLAIPDVDIAQPGMMIAWIADIIRATPLPVLVDASNGGIDAKSLAYTVTTLEAAGAAALFLEDQASPKRCGHMANKHVFPLKRAVARLQIARDLLHRDTFLLARTDAYACEGIDGVLRRGIAYLNDACVDGLYVEGVDNEADLEKIGREFSGRCLALSILEGGGKTPWLTAGRAAELGYALILYPTTVLFGALDGIRRGLDDLRAGLPRGGGTTLDEYLRLVDIDRWSALEAREDG
jgi:2-methylisocitrate lyase-like PEP mutase family enzyme